jgi:hypothetical protein
MNLFTELTDNKWKIKFFGSSPILHTLRQFSEHESQDPLNEDLKGVRTFWFGAHHWRGLPEMVMEDTQYNDWAWVPKR